MFRVLCETWDSTVPPLLGIGFPRHSSCRDSRLGCPGRAKPARVERTLLSVASDVDLDLTTPPPPQKSGAPCFASFAKRGIPQCHALFGNWIAPPQLMWRQPPRPSGQGKARP